MFIVDHLFVIALATLLPWVAWRSQRQQIALVRRGENPNRPQLYRRTAIEQWGLFAALTLYWLWQQRSVADLGYVAPAGTGFWIGVLVAMIVLGGLTYAWHKATAMSAREKREQLATLGELAPLLPQDVRDLRNFGALSVTAGVVEETVFRGYLFWYFTPFLPLWGVVLLTGLMFGVAHCYQGYRNAARITAIGVAFGALYVLTGSIWVPIVLHALADIVQGFTLVELSRRKPPSEHAASPAG